MKSNFEFLNKYWEDLYEIGRLAEGYLFSDPNACIYKIGVLSEKILLKVFDYEKITLPEDSSQLNLIKILRREGLLPANIDNILYTIRKTRNKAVHDNLNSFNDAKTLLSLSYKLAVWFMEVYGDWSFTPEDYQEPEQPENIDDLKALLEEQENKIAELTDNLQHIHTAASEISAEERSDLSASAAEKIDLSKEEKQMLTEEPVHIEVSYIPAVNFALQQNKAKVIDSILLKNQTAEPIEKITLRITSNPNITMPFERIYDYIPADGEVIDKKVDLHLDVDFLARLTERVDGLITLSVFEEEHVLCTEIIDVSVLAYDQWQGIGIYPETLAAFVTPNHPFISKIKNDAAVLLNQWTRNPSFDAYQSGDKNRVRYQAAAVYGAIQKLGIRYCVSPSSFENVGQRLRLCETIASTNEGNCIDMSLLFAGCLMAIGIHPLIVIEKSHAYAGYWLSNEYFMDTVCDDATVMTKRMAASINDIRLVECTAMNQGKGISFDDAEAIADQRIKAAGDEFECVIDVKSAALNRIRPIPNRIESLNGYRIEREEPDVTISAPKPISFADDYDFVESGEQDDQIPKMEQWERKLLDLSLRNPLINMHLSRSIVPILTTSIQNLEDSLADSEKYMIFPKPTEWKNSELKDDFASFSAVNDISEYLDNEAINNRLHSSLSESELARVLKALYRKSRTSMEENGANTLYLVLGLLKWCDPKKRSVFHYAPLILLPIDMVRKTSDRTFEISLRDEEPQINITILEKLKQDFGIDVKRFTTLPEDDHGINVGIILKNITNSIINQPYWDVLESAYLGEFSFSQFVMWNDLHSRADVISENKIVKSLINRQLSWETKSMITPDSVDEDKDVYLPIPVDGSQLYAIQQANEGNSFVLEGPPGTGKSQTITALIANALGHGKKVLFVAEKRAALEVVQKRLTEIGLDPFCLELHSNKAKKTVVLDKLNTVKEIKRKSVRESKSAEAQLRHLKDELDIYAAELHKKVDNGLSLYEAINKYEEFSSAPGIKNLLFLEPDKVTLYELETKYQKIGELGTAGNNISHPFKHPLLRLHKNSYTHAWKENLIHDVEGYKEEIENLHNLLKEAGEAVEYQNDGSYQSAETLMNLLSSLNTLSNYPSGWTRAENPKAYFDNLAEVIKCEKQADALLDEIGKNWKPEITSVNTDQVLASYQQFSERSGSRKLKGFIALYRELKTYRNQNSVLDYELLGIDESDLISYSEEELDEKYELIQDLIERANKTAVMRNGQLGRVGLAENTLTTGRTIRLLANEYIQSIAKYAGSVDQMAKAIDMRSRDKKSWLEEIEFIALNLREWTGIPMAMARAKNPSFYFADIRLMAEQYLKAAELKNELLQKWEEVFLQEDGQARLDEYKEINQLGIFSKMNRMSHFTKALSACAKTYVDKTTLSNDLSHLATYQQALKTADDLFEKYGKDLDYLYTGQNTDWQKVAEAADDILGRCHSTDAALRTDQYRIKYAGDPELSAVVFALLSDKEKMEQAKREFYSFLNVRESGLDTGYLNAEKQLVAEILKNEKGIRNLISFNAACRKAADAGFDFVVNEIKDGRYQNVVTMQELMDSLKTVNEYQKLKESVKDRKTYLEELSGTYDLKAGRWNTIIEDIEECRKRISKNDQIEGFREYRLRYASDKSIVSFNEELAACHTRFIQMRNKVYESAEIKDSILSEDWYNSEMTLCNGILSNADQLRDWTVYRMTADNCCRNGLKAVVNAYESGMAEADLLPSYKKEYFQQLCSEIISASNTLSLFSGKLFEEKIRQFKELDEKLHEINQKLIFNNLVRQVPDFTAESYKSNEVSYLERAIRSRGRGQSLRHIFEKAPSVLTRLCPCMLMSPISVAQYLDPAFSLFDLIVFDEASQLQTCKAVGAIARAKNAVIVGDRNQMPPTTFFMTNTDNEEDYEINDLESILDDCTAMSMPTSRLLWHYRSTHESLIAFSNNEFYDNSLYTFPSVNDRESKVRFIKVAGTYENKSKRINKAEAEQIVQELKRRCRSKEDSPYSVGVVTFNISQQNLIEDLIAEECVKDARFDHWVNRDDSEPLFIKNLENIQGDERDIILFSITYGPNENGKISMNFGPLNREGGGRRLNVAVSRARREMIVYSSMIPEDIDLTRTKSKGVMELRSFLEYAASGRLTMNAGNVHSETYYSEGIIDSIIDDLKDHGFNCDKMVGHSSYRIDIGIIDPRNPEKYILGILLDGPNYQIANTTRDREVAKINILKNLGWDVYRIWSMDWWHQKKKYLNDIERIINSKLSAATVNSEPVNEQIQKNVEVIDKPQEEPVTAETAEKENTDVIRAEPVLPAAEPKYEEPPVVKLPEIQPAKTDIEIPKQLKNNKTGVLHIRSKAYVRAVKPANKRFSVVGEHSLEAIARTILEKEAPITATLLAERICEWFGIQKTNSAYSSIQEYVSELDMQCTLLGGQKVFWGDVRTEEMYYEYRYPTIKMNLRTYDEIPYIEIINAMYDCMANGRFVTSDILIKEANTKLNGTLGDVNKLTADRKTEYTKALLAGVRIGRIKEITKGTYVQGGQKKSESAVKKAEDNPVQLSVNLKSSNMEILSTVQESLKNKGFTVIDDKSKSDFIWVLYQKDKADDFEEICQVHDCEYYLERRGAIITEGKKAWRINRRD